MIFWTQRIFKGIEPTKFLHLAYLTGILPIKKVKTQSALNNFDGLKTAIITMLSGNDVKVKTMLYQNDMITFKNKDDVLTALIHLGYLAYDQRTETTFIPNEEIRIEFVNAIEEMRCQLC